MAILENIMTNIYRTNVRTSESEGAQKDVRSMSPEEAAKLEKAALYRELMPENGVPVRGEVMDLRMNSVILKLLTGEEISARTEKPLPLSIGDTADFIVTANDGKVVTLKLASTDLSVNDTKKSQLIETTLKASNIPVNERSVNVVNELINHSQSISEANIRKYIMLSHKFPEADVKELLLMDMNNIEITKDNVRLFKAFNQNAARLVPEMAKASEELEQAVSEIKNPEVKEALLKELSYIRDLSKTAIEYSDTPSAELPAFGSSFVKSDFPNEAAGSSDIDVTPMPNEISEAVSEDVVPGFDSEKAAFPEKTLLPDAAPKLSERSSAPLSQKGESPVPLSIPPERFSADTVKKFYSRLKEISDKLEKLKDKVIEQKSIETAKAAAEDTPDSSARILPHTNNLNSTVKFVETLNNFFPYIQIPVKLKEENAHGELYVYEKKKVLKNSESLSALLHLELDSLGPTDIYVKLSGTNVYASFSVSSDKSGKIFESEISSLSEALGRRGYTLSSDVKLQEKGESTPPLLTEFLEAHSPSSVTRFTFDMRA